MIVVDFGGPGACMPHTFEGVDMYIYATPDCVVTLTKHTVGNVSETEVEVSHAAISIEEA